MRYTKQLIAITVIILSIITYTYGVSSTVNIIVPNIEPNCTQLIHQQSINGEYIDICTDGFYVPEELSETFEQSPPPIMKLLFNDTYFGMYYELV